MASDKKDLVKFSRLAFRVEGDFWNCYFVGLESMQGAVLMGSLRMTLAVIPKRKQQFQELMHDAFGDVAEGVLGVRPTEYVTVAAPERDRTKKA